MAAQIAIIHGWSDSSKSFHDLRDYLTANGHAATELWLSDYISMDDDVRIEDVAKRMQQVILASIAKGDLTAPFDLIVHSTGGLVAREWVMTFYPDGAACPAKRIVMLAPANFGSKLASTGKSMIGRVLKGWNNWFHTGRQMLDDLELASPYQWELARRDLLDPANAGGGPYKPGGSWPFVIVGAQGYTDGLRQIINERGSDGTVRVPAANLNAIGMTIDFTAGGTTAPTVTPWSRRTGFARIPFAVLPNRNHSSIVHPEQALDQGDEALGALILEALRCDSDAAYAKIADRWAGIADRTGTRGDVPGGEAYHQYMQAIVKVVDDHGRPVNDYFLEFFDPARSGGKKDDDQDSVFFHKEVLEDVHTNAIAPSLRSLYFDRTDLLRRFYQGIGKEVAMSISAAPIGQNIRYFDKDQKGAKAAVVIHRDRLAPGDTLDGARFFRNTTHLIEIRIPRQPIDKVFQLIR